MSRVCDQQRVEIHFAKRKRAGLGREKLTQLCELVGRYHLAVVSGDVLYISNNWYITHAGLLRLAHRNHCLGIKTALQKRCSDPLAGRWIFKAIVYKSAVSKGFVGYGDADPSNVSPLVRGAKMRVAETRAVNRALRKAYGIGPCSVEELGWEPRTFGPSDPQKPSSAMNNNGYQNGSPRLRDRLCLLIRQHQLDAISSKLMPPILAVVLICGMPLANRSKPSLRTSLIGQRRTAQLFR